MEQGDSHCPYDVYGEPTAKGTGLGGQRGKKTLLSLTLVRRRRQWCGRSEVGKDARPLAVMTDALVVWWGVWLGRHDC